jgi:hypothetical protein
VRSVEVRSGGEVKSGEEVSSAGVQAETSFWKASSTVPKCGNLFSLSFFFFSGLGFKLRASHWKAGALPLKPPLQSLLLW